MGEQIGQTADVLTLEVQGYASNTTVFIVCQQQQVPSIFPVIFLPWFLVNQVVSVFYLTAN